MYRYKITFAYDGTNFSGFQIQPHKRTVEQVLKNAAIVVGCVIAIGIFIWLFDFVAQVGIDALIGVFH